MRVMVVKEFTFDSAHYLPGYIGKCHNLHGHTYKLQVGFAGEPNQSDGMVIDFNQLKTRINEILESIDHRYLNALTNDNSDLMNFPANTPTAENMVMWFVEYFQTYFIFNGVQLALVRLWETPTSYAEWNGEK